MTMYPSAQAERCKAKRTLWARLRSGRRHIASIELSDSKVRFYGTTALVTSFAHVTGTNAEGEALGDYRYTHVYARNAQGKWKMVSLNPAIFANPARASNCERESNHLTTTEIPLQLSDA